MDEKAPLEITITLLLSLCYKIYVMIFLIYDDRDETTKPKHRGNNIAETLLQ